MLALFVESFFLLGKFFLTSFSVAFLLLCFSFLDKGQNCIMTFSIFDILKKACG